MRISIYTLYLKSGGAEKVISCLVNYLPPNYKVTIVLNYNLVELKLPENIQIVALTNKIESPGWITALLETPFLIWKYYCFCKSHRIELSISFLNRPNFVNSVLKILGLKCKIFLFERSSPITLLQNQPALIRFFTKTFIFHFFSLADKIVTNSIGSKNEMEKLVKKSVPIENLYNPIDITFIEREKKALVEFTSKFRFINIGRFVKSKNQISLIRAFAIFSQGKNCELILMGKGPMKNIIFDMANKLGVRGKIIYISFDSNPYKYLYNSDCFISTSLIEGFPNVLLESLACQLPIIAADCPSGPREILSNKYRVMDKPINKLEVEEYGILIPTNDLISNLIKAMELIYNDKELREKYKAKSNDRANEFGVQHFITNFERIIQ